MRQRMLVLWVALAGAARLSGQNISCTLAGALEDPQGAALPSVEVKVSSTQTGFLRTTRTNETGLFSLPDLLPATYDLSVAAPGFKTYRQSGIALSSGERRSLGVLRLAVGDIADSVTVSAEVNPVMLESGERAAALTQDELSTMALRGRDFIDAIGLLPGVVDLNEGREAPNPSNIDGIYIGGGRNNQKNVTIDGVTNLNTGSSTMVHTTPSIVSVAEVKVLMSNYQAEHGRNSGGAITVITRGGGKSFHGSGGWYHRHEKFNANDYFFNRNGLPRALYRYNIADYTLSGPVFIPGRFNADRSKLFFFWSQEFQRQLVSFGSKTVRVPTGLERSGDFSRSFDVNGRLIPIYDPLNKQQLFSGNVVPASRFHKTGIAILNLFPLPNFVDPSPSRLHQWNYISAASGGYPRRTDTLRVDYSPRQNFQMYARLTESADAQRIPFNYYVAGSVNFPLTPIVFSAPGRGVTLHTTATISPRTFNELILGFSTSNITRVPEEPDRVRRAATGILVPQWNPRVNPDDYIPNMSFGGVPNFANPSMSNMTPSPNQNVILSLVDNLSRIAGPHTLKFGIYVERTRKEQYASVASRGSIDFGVNRVNAFDANYAWTNALLGNYNSYSEASARPQGRLRFTNVEWYAQDAWKVRRGLSLDYGVRFYHGMPLYDARDQLATFVPSRYDPKRAPVLLRPGFDATRARVAADPLSGRTYPAAFIGTYVPGVGDPAIGMAVGGSDGFPRGLYTLPAVSVAPRAGFAWDPFGKGRTAVRGGGGIFYDCMLNNPTINQLNNPPIVYSPAVYYGTLDGLAQTASAGILAPGAVYSLTGSGSAITYNYSLGVQHRVGRGVMLDAAYVGSLTRDNLWQRNLNAVPQRARHLDVNPQNADPTIANSSLPPNFLRPYQAYGDIFQYEFRSASNYNSLQFSFNRQMAQGLQFGGAYTFSKALGSAEGDASRVSPFFSARSRDYGLLDYDRTHVFSLRYSWILPKPAKALGVAYLGLVTDGWEMSGIARIISGAPFTPGLSTVDNMDFTGTPSEAARPDIGDPRADPAERFARPVRGSFGNAGVNVLRGPRVNNWDISLYRRIRISEHKSAQLRLETYNTFNHTQFSALSTGARFDAAGRQADPLFLQPTSARGPRRIQLAARFMW